MKRNSDDVEYLFPFSEYVIQYCLMNRVNDISLVVIVFLRHIEMRKKLSLILV